MAAWLRGQGFLALALLMGFALLAKAGEAPGAGASSPLPGKAALLSKAARSGDADDPYLSPPLAEGVWMHVSHLQTKRWGRIRSNGLVVARGDDEAVLVDTAWNDAQTRKLLALIRDQLGRRVVGAVATHAHDDKMGGIGVLREAGIPTYAHPDANALAPRRALVAAQFDLELQGDGEVSAEEALQPLEVYFPGAGHTLANLVVHAPGAGVLFGGCLVRPGGASTLGNTADGDTAAWGASVQAAAERFPSAKVVIPSHGEAGGRQLLSHTIALAAAAPRGD